VSGSIIALLIGLLVIPSYLLFLGNRFRYKSGAQRGRFWGGIIGHSAGAIIALIAMMAPPIWWAGGGAMREMAVYWSMLVFSIIGLIAGSIFHGSGATEPR
jgi:hypothetical protein